MSERESEDEFDGEESEYDEAFQGSSSVFRGKLILNEYFSYTDAIEEESRGKFAQIKENLGKAVILRELEPGCLYWTKQLANYLYCYRIQFSKGDHLVLVRLLYHLVTIDDLDVTLLGHFAGVLHNLIKRKHLLSRSDLVLQWRPLYLVYRRVFGNLWKPIQTIHVPNYVKTAVVSLISVARIYFPLDSTQEMLDEFRQFICPFLSNETKMGMDYFERFIPVYPNENDPSIRLWFDEFLKMWLQNSPNLFWKKKMMSLFSRVAKENIGYINWNPFIPAIFERFKSDLQLPVFQIQSSKSLCDLKSVAVFLVSMLGGNSACQKHLTQMLKPLESFYHPSNVGPWKARVQRLMSALSSAMLDRVRCERHRMGSLWPLNVPEESRLTDDDIVSFVTSLMPCIMFCMFSKNGCNDAASTLRIFAALRPELLLPSIIERFYGAVESQNEPHRLLAVMQCLTYVSGPLVRGGENYDEGRSHVLNILNSCLPAIDCNDVNKSLSAFQLIVSLVGQIPLVDCSHKVADRADLSETDKELCLSTYQFKDFVLLFLDRCFVLVENSALESFLVTDETYNTVNRDEDRLLFAMNNAFNIIILQSSSEICQVAIRKLHDYVSGHIMSVKDSGYMVAKLVRATVQKCDFSFRLFLPSIIEVIESNLEENCDFSEPSNELLFNLLLLQELVYCDGRILLDHRESLLTVLKKVMQLTDKSGHCIACKVLENGLVRLTTIYPSEYGVSVEEDPDHLPIQDWGKSVNLKDLKISWHTGSDAENEFAQTLVDTFLTSEITKLTDLCDEQIHMSSIQLQQSLAVVYSVLKGCLSVCPFLDDGKLPRAQSVVSMEPLPHTIGYDRISSLTIGDGKNIRKELIKFLHRLTHFMLEKHEDNIVAFRCVIRTSFLLLFYWGDDFETYNQDWKKSFKTMKLIESPFKGKNKHLRLVFIQSVFHKHLERATIYSREMFSDLHLLVMKDFLVLSLNHYSAVRSKAQLMLKMIFKDCMYSYRHLLLELASMVANSSCENDELKEGLLRLLRSKETRTSLVLQTDLQTLSVLWPVFFKTTSDKPLINRLLNEIVDCIVAELPTFAIVATVPQSTFDSALSLWSSVSGAIPSTTPPSEEEISAAHDCLTTRNEANVRKYYDFIGDLVTLLQTPNLHWQNKLFGLKLLSKLIRSDMPFPLNAVQNLVGVLNNTHPTAKIVAMDAILLILRQMKSRIAPVEVEWHDIANKLDYDKNTIPTTNAQWKKRLFVDKPHVGFFQQPHRVLVSRPSPHRPWKHRSEMSETEAVIYDFFTSPEIVNSFIRFLYVERNDKVLDLKRCYFFKNLFKTFGEEVLDVFKSKLERFTRSKKEEKQRTALEIICGLVAGSKDWPFKTVSRLWTYLDPLFKQSMKVISKENIKDWIRGMDFMIKNRDPIRLHWLLEIITNDLLAPDESSSVQSNRLSILAFALSKHPIRLTSVRCELMDTVKPHLSHSYEDVRQAIGCLLAQLLTVPCHQCIVIDIVSSRLATDDMESEESVALLSTVCHWLRERFLTTTPWTADLYRLLPLLCKGCACRRDPALEKNCRISVGIMARILIQPDMISTALETVEAVSNSSSWKCRRSSIEFIQVFVFSNLFVLLQHTDCMERLKNIVLRSLMDVQPEVQQEAGLALSGFFHSDILKFDQTILNNFMDMSETPVRNIRGAPVIVEGAVQRRHAGILGLCAFVGAHPYDIVDRMPEVLVTLGDHLRDPQPLQSTVRTALTNFWRTHHDAWHEHKLNFMDVQLAALTDFLISPSYFA